MCNAIHRLGGPFAKLSPSIFCLPTNFNSWTRVREQEVGICLRGTSSMRPESHSLRIPPVDELGRPLSCRPNGPISRLNGIYPRISSDFTCVCLRHTDTVTTTYPQQHGLKEDVPDIWLNAQAIVSFGTLIPSNSRVGSASQCREESTSTSFSSSDAEQTNMPSLSYLALQG
ncbi:hypothetical protein N431DRAFT_507601 [Stipitochalara longipes BDJ]|nr:hypothetical protein N431DRAFT_507601 [Stipitochalara longipes BDJ]